MAQKELDALSGTETTGHEWDGLKELNTPLPKWWLYVFYACIAFSAVYVVLFPALPGWSGLLGITAREELTADLEQQRLSRAVWEEKFNTLTVDQIAADPELMQYAMAGGAAVFGENCAPCHGSGGAGAPGYPVLADDDWLWGGTLDAIATTIRHGIRNTTDDDARVSDMPAFGADGTLNHEQIEQVADYVLSLNGEGKATKEGAAIFEENCAACHGEDGKGNHDVGAPNLTNGIWLFTGTKDKIMQQVFKPHQGVMPAWQGRLSDAEIKEAAIYVHSRGGGQ